MFTLVSPLANFPRSAGAGEVPNRSQMVSVRAGWEFPEKICTPRMADLLGEELKKKKEKTGDKEEEEVEKGKKTLRKKKVQRVTTCGCGGCGLP